MWFYSIYKVVVLLLLQIRKGFKLNGGPITVIPYSRDRDSSTRETSYKIKGERMGGISQFSTSDLVEFTQKSTIKM